MPQFGKILLRVVVEGAGPSKQQVFEVIQKNLKMPLTGLRDVKSGFNAFTEYEKDVEVLLTKKGREELSKINLEARLTPKVKANRSVICRQIDQYVGNHDKDAIKTEIERCNSQLTITEVIKFGTYSHVFKIEFETTEMANNVILNGFLCFNLKITSSQVQKEDYIDIMMCFKCYKMECHITRDCPDKDIVLCSECSGPHDYRQCTEIVKRCINCGGNHRTMAMSCPVKKDLIKKKRELKSNEQQTKDETTYAKIVEKTLKNVEQQKENEIASNVMKDQGMRAMLIIIDAHLHNIIQPGSYSTHLNETLKLNKIAPIITINNPDSAKLFDQPNIGKALLTLKEVTHKKDDQSDNESESSSSSSDNNEVDFGHSGLSDKSEGEKSPRTQDNDILERHAVKMKYMKRTPREIGMKLYSRVGTINKEVLQSADIVQLFKEGRLKYSLSPDSTHTQEDIESHILMGNLREHRDNIILLSTAEFKKRRNGPERTPPRPEQQRKVARK